MMKGLTGSGTWLSTKSLLGIAVKSHAHIFCYRMTSIGDWDHFSPGARNLAVTIYHAVAGL